MQAFRVLNVFWQDTQRKRCGAELMDALCMPSGTLYPILVRFENDGLLKSKWEKGSATDLGRPRRRLYRITPTGVRAAKAAWTELGLGESGLGIA